MVLTIYAVSLTPVLRNLLYLELTPRILISVVLIAPLGLLMGMPMPLGISMLNRMQPELIPWMWGINGATSVVASVLAMVVSLNIGLRGTLLVGMVIYGIAWFAIWGIQRRASTDAQQPLPGELVAAGD